MSNMSYCRFQNTDGDLADCADDLERRSNHDIEDEDGHLIEPLSQREEQAAIRLIARCRDLIQLVLDETGLEFDDLDSDRHIESFVSDLQEEAERTRATQDEQLESEKQA